MNFIYKKSSLILISLFVFIGNVNAADLVGIWKLVSLKDNANVFPCHAPTGLLMYTASGYMAVGINCMKEGTSEPSFDSKDYTFYLGKYSVKGDEVIHDVENTSYPAFYGKNLTRKITMISDHEMVLTAEIKKGNFLKLIWKKE